MLDTEVDEHEVAVIHAITDDSTRNNEITLAYHHLSELLARVTRSESANWCAWAKWTSKTIGVGIRWGEVRDLARKRVDEGRDRILDRWAAGRAVRYFFVGAILRMLTTSTRLAGRPLADGNRDVFYEVGVAVTRLAQRFGEADQLDRPALDAYLAELEAVAPAGSLGEAPLDHMREAMRCFVLARFAGTQPIRDQRVLAANLNLAAYEQLRLQAVVERSLWAPVDFVFRPLRFVSRAVPAPVRRPVGTPVRAVRGLLRRMAVRIATRFVLVVATKDEVIRLGKPMPPAPGQTAVFPPPYDRPRCSHLNRACNELLGADVDLDHALARTWTEYSQRVRFTAVLFRSRHLHPSLREPPMSPDEAAVIDAEREELDPSGDEWVATSA